MKKKVVDLNGIRRGLAALDKLAAEHPRLLGKSTPEEWEETLTEVLKRKTVYTTAEAAELLSCHEQTIRREIRKGKLPAAKVGNDWRISRADLQTYWRSVGGEQLFSTDLETSTVDQQAAGPKICPECDHVFQGKGWDGIDAHWRANHEDIIRYEEAWPMIKSGTYKRQ